LSEHKNVKKRVFEKKMKKIQKQWLVYGKTQLKGFVKKHNFQNGLDPYLAIVVSPISITCEFFKKDQSWKS